MKPEGWRYPVWELVDDDYWHLRQGGTLVGEVYRRDDGTIKWHCKTSDWRDTYAATIEQAKAECECSFWKEAWHVAVEGKGPKPAAHYPLPREHCPLIRLWN